MKTEYNLYNIYALKKKVPNYKEILFFSIILFIFSFILLFFKYSEKISFNGVYTNQLIKSVIPVSYISYWRENKQIEIEGKLYSISNVKFFDPEFDSSNQVVQMIQFNIEKLDYYENQTISFSIEKKSDFLINIIFDSLKGGDEK